MSNKNVIFQSAQKALASDAKLGAICQIIFAAGVAYAFSDVYSEDYVKTDCLIAVLLVSVARLGNILFAKNISSKNWMYFFTLQMAITSIVWSIFFIDMALSNKTATMMLPFIFLGPLSLCAASFLTLSVAPRIAMIFQLPLQLSMLVSFIVVFHDAKAAVLGTIGTLIFTAYSLFAQKSLYKTWANLQLFNQDLQNVIDAIPGGLSVIQNGIYVKVNSYVTATLKAQDKDFLNKTIQDVYPQSEFTQALVSFANSGLVRQQKKFSMPTVLGLRTHYIIFRKLQIQGQNERIIISSFDIEDLKQAQQDLERQNAKLEHNAKMASLGEMSSGLAHEINNPLAVISARAQIMQTQLDANFYDKTQYAKSVETILSMTVRITKIIKSLKLFAKDTSSEVFESASLNEIIEQTIALCEVRVVTQSVEVSKVGLEKNYVLDCLPIQVSQVLLNALNNSFDAIENLSEKWIRVQIIEDGLQLRIEITDSGKGIPATNQEKVMRPFFTTKGAGSGTGLGLSLSKRIVENHGGRMFFDYKCENTKLVFTLPKQQFGQSKVALKTAS